jgi:hypothetical protein
MTKAITIRGVDYIYFVRTGNLYSVKPSGLPSAGAILTPVHGARRTKIIDALCV